MKPLTGSGGAKVFLIQEQDRKNLHQIIDAVLEEGYGLAQEYLPAAEEGDTRLFLMNAGMLESDGKVAVFRREARGGDLRSNITAGGIARPTEVTEAMIRIVDLVRPRLVQDGMFLVGLDIVGNKVLEVNVFTPGGIHSAGRVNGVNFFPKVIRALERKLELKKREPGAHWNIELATL